MFIFALTIYAGMVKLVDMPDLGSGAARRVGSSPITRTEKALTFVRAFFCCKLVNNNVYSLLILSVLNFKNSFIFTPSKII